MLQQNSQKNKIYNLQMRKNKVYFIRFKNKVKFKDYNNKNYQKKQSKQECSIKTKIFFVL